MINAKIKCYAGWAGGKRTLAPRIVEHLGEHHTYVEPFVGGCSILPAKPRSTREVVNDSNPKIVNVLKCLRDHSEAIQRLLATVKFSKGEFSDAVDKLEGRDGGDREHAAWQLIAWWMGPGGIAGTTTKGWFAQRHSKTGGDPAKRWDSFKASIPALSERLQGVRIEGGDWYYSLFNAPVNKPAAIYVDPPYFSKSFKYECDFKQGEHERLATVLNDLARSPLMRIVVSYRDEIDDGLFGGGSILDDLYPPDRWRRIEVEMNKNMASASGAARRNTEVLMVNIPA